VRIELLRLLADIELASGRAPAAIDLLRRSVDEIDALYDHIPGAALQMAFFRDRHGAFADLAWLLCESGSAREGFEMLERGRARSLRLGPLRLRRDPELRAAQEHLSWLIARSLDAELEDMGKREIRPRRPTATELREAEADVLRLERAFEKRASARLEPETTDLLAAASGDTLVSYLVTSRGTLAFVARDGELQAVTLDVDAEAIRLLRNRLLLQLDKFRLGPEYSARHRRALSSSVERVLDELGDGLLAPIEDRLGGSGLIVLPYGDLHDLPFHALRIRAAYVVEHTEVSYGFSASMLARCRRRHERTAATMLATGAPDRAAPEIGAEIDSLRRTYGEGLEVVEPAALLDRLRALESGGTLLHVASHGLFRPQDPRSSGLRLGSRYVTARELLELALDFDLVTLSGCETGRKLRVEGEELLGLSHALFRGGARCVVGSLWPVPDERARRLMADFYAALASGLPVRAAVTRVQREWIAADPHPFAWASFAVYGAPDVTVQN
jgi:CHAT domain-containing protein